MTSFITVLFGKPPFGADAPLSPIGGKRPFYRAFSCPQLGEGCPQDRKGASLKIHRITIFNRRSNNIKKSLWLIYIYGLLFVVAWSGSPVVTTKVIFKYIHNFIYGNTLYRAFIATDGKRCWGGKIWSKQSKKIWQQEDKTKNNGYFRITIEHFYL